MATGGISRRLPVPRFLYRAFFPMDLALSRCFPRLLRVVLYLNSDAALMSAASVLRGVGNKVYQHAFPIYRPLYAAYKAYADRAERQLLKKILFQGAVVVDAALTSEFTREFLSRCVGPTGLVHSFEPSPDNFKRLSAATRNLSNVRLTQAAVGERSGECKLYISDKLNVDHRAYKADGDSRRAVPIRNGRARRLFQTRPTR